MCTLKEIYPPVIEVCKKRKNSLISTDSILPNKKLQLGQKIKKMKEQMMKILIMN